MESFVVTPSVLAENLCWLLSTAAWNLTTEMTAALENLGVSPRDLSVLSTAMSGTYTQTELARKVGLDKTTMVVTLDELEAARLAERRPSAADRRARVIAVTPAGRRMVHEAEAVADRVREDVLAVLDPAEREALVGALKRLVCERLSAPAQCSHAPRRRAPRG